MKYPNSTRHRKCTKKEETIPHRKRKERKDILT